MTKQDVVRRWLGKAESDLKAACALGAVQDGDFHDQACFARAAVEAAERIQKAAEAIFGDQPRESKVERRRTP